MKLGTGWIGAGVSLIGLLWTPGMATCAELPAKALPADLMRGGMSRLKEGRQLEQAIALFADAAAREPLNPTAHTYLAAACAARAYVLCRYVEDVRNQESLKQWYAQIESDVRAAGQNKDNPLAKYALPASPAPPRTRDDDRVPKQTEAEILEIVRSLTTRAQAALTTADRLLGEKRTDEAITLRNLQGWSAVLLVMEPYRLLPSAVPAPRSGAAPPLSERDETFRFLQKTLRHALDARPSAAQRRTTGDAFIIAAHYPVLRGARLQTGERGTLAEGLQLVEHDAPRSPQPAATYYWIAEHQQAIAPKASLPFLRCAMERDSANAFYAYTYAAHVMATNLDKPFATGQTDADEIAGLIRQGNQGTLRPPSYSVAAPLPLRWVFADYPRSDLMTTGMLHLHFERVCADLLDQGRHAQAMQRLGELADCAKQFLRAGREPSLTAREQERCLSTGWMLLSAVGSLVAAAKFRGVGSEYTGDVEYALAFAPARWKRRLNLPSPP